MIKHLINDDIHVTAEDKERWNNIVIPDQIVYTEGNNIAISDENAISVLTTDVIDESDMIPTSKAVYDAFFENKSFNNFNSSIYTEKADTAGTVVLSKKHFISGGRITKVTVPHGTTTGQYGDLDNGDPGYLVIDVFEENNSFAEGYDKNNPTYRYRSDNYYAYRNLFYDGHYEWTFNNTNCIIPDNYKAVHLSIVIEENDVANVGVGSSANARFRINCLAKNGDREEGVVYEEDDECCLYWNGSTSGANRVAIVEVEYKVDKLANLSQNEKYDEHLSNTTIHITEEDKEAIAKIPAIEANAGEVASLTATINGHIDDTDIHFSKDLIMDGIVEESEGFEERTWDFSKGSTNIAAAQGIAYAEICS